MSDHFETLLDLALEEDLGDRGDVTSRAIFTENDWVAARLMSKDRGVLAGSRDFARVFERVDSDTGVEFCKQDGDALEAGELVARVKGRTASVLEAERTAVNFLSFLSGIASQTRLHTEAARQRGRTVILDTRKTLPGYRRLSKEAVLAGGGANHRMGLYDLVMIKDNHIDAAGSIGRAVEMVRRRWKGELKIEVECRTADEVEEALSAGADIIMLDNMSVEETGAAVDKVKGRALLEGSGNMTVEKIKAYSGLGLDYLSAGGLTHSVRAFDFSLQIGSL